MQIRNIKGIVKALPVDLVCYDKPTSTALMIGVLDADIDISECAEVDVVLLKRAIRECARDCNALWEEQDKVDNLGIRHIAEAIAKSGCIKWKEGGKE